MICIYSYYFTVNHIHVLSEIEIKVYTIQIWSGITHGRVLNEELSAQRLQKLIYLHLSTDCFMKISLHSS